MTTSISSSLFCSPYSTISSRQSSHSNSSFVKLRRSRISAAYATAERTNISPVTLYEVLGVEIGAGTREVKSAYRRLARVLHPDVCESSSADDDFIKVHSAYATLADPVKRAEYDRSLVQMRAGGLTPVTSVGGFRSTNRRWETDHCW